MMLDTILGPGLLPDESDEPLRHPQIPEFFEDLRDGVFRSRYVQEH